MLFKTKVPAPFLLFCFVVAADEEMPLNRPKRRRVDRTGRLEALEKIRSLKGKKNKYDVNEMQNVYDVVDEEEYKERVLKKAGENWLEEDEEGDYIEDGREIFDDDESFAEPAGSKKYKKAQQKKAEAATAEPETKSHQKISKFFANMPTKQVVPDLASDVVLENILQDLKNAENVEPPPSAVGNVEIETKSAKVLTDEATVAKDADSKVDYAIFSNVFDDDEEVAVVSEPVPEKTSEVNGNVQKSSLPKIPLGAKVKMWIWDIHEDFKDRQLFLFGKTEHEGALYSICVKITDVEHQLYVLPRETDSTTGEPVSESDVYQEFDSIVGAYKINEHKAKFVTKKINVFPIPGVESSPSQISKYMMIKYSGKKPKIPSTPKQPYKKIDYIFGCDASAMETFLLDRKIKGPCWVMVEKTIERDYNPSRCKLFIECDTMASINLCTEIPSSPPPPLSILSLNLRVGVNSKNQNEIVLISGLVHKEFHIDKPAPKKPFQEDFCIVSHPSNMVFPHDFRTKATSYKNAKIASIVDKEKSLLNVFLGQMQKYDPDLIITQDAYARQLDVLCARIKANVDIKLGCARLSKLIRPNFPNTDKVEDFFVGRMICDIKSSATELKQKMRSYDMQSLCKAILNIADSDRRDIYADEIPSFYEKTEKLFEFINRTVQDNFYSVRLMCELNCLPLALEITKIAGNLMSHTLRGGRSERNEYLLLHAFSEQDYIVPEKQKRMPKTKATTEGGK